MLQAEAISKNEQLAKQWKQFAQTDAFKEFMDYIELQDYLAVQGAKGPINTFEDADGEQLSFDKENAVYLLQRSVGYDIVKTYVEGYINFEA